MSCEGVSRGGPHGWYGGIGTGAPWAACQSPGVGNNHQSGRRRQVFDRQPREALEAEQIDRLDLHAVEVEQRPNWSCSNSVNSKADGGAFLPLRTRFSIPKERRLGGVPNVSGSTQSRSPSSNTANTATFSSLSLSRTRHLCGKCSVIPWATL